MITPNPTDKLKKICAAASSQSLGFLNCDHAESFLNSNAPPLAATSFSASASAAAPTTSLGLSSGPGDVFTTCIFDGFHM